VFSTYHNDDPEDVEPSDSLSSSSFTYSSSSLSKDLAVLVDDITPVGRNLISNMYFQFHYDSDSRVPSFRINHDSVYFQFYYVRKAAFSSRFTGFLVYHSRRPVVIRSRICIFSSIILVRVKSCVWILTLRLNPAVSQSSYFGLVGGNNSFYFPLVTWFPI
jgi:sensor histidine kinase YesM